MKGIAGRALLQELSQAARVIREFFAAKQQVAAAIARNPVVIELLGTCTAAGRTVEHPLFPGVVRYLSEVKRGDPAVYLSFVGIAANNDAIDNFGRSRQAECLEGLREAYEATGRGWYRETLAAPGKATVTLPYRDTSGSYIISVTHEATDRSGRHLGVAGVDVNINTAVKLARCSRRLVVLTITGEIVYDSHGTPRGVIEQRNNAKMLMPREPLLEVLAGETGTAVTEYDGRPAILAFRPMVPGKYFLLHLLAE